MRVSPLISIAKHTEKLQFERSSPLFSSAGAETIVELWLNVAANEEPSRSSEQNTVAEVAKTAITSQPVPELQSTITIEPLIKHEPPLDIPFPDIPILHSSLDSLPILVDPFKNEPLLEDKLLENIPMPAMAITTESALFTSNPPLHMPLNLSSPTGLTPIVPVPIANLPSVSNLMPPILIKTECREANESGLTQNGPQPKASPSTQPIATSPANANKPVQLKKLMKCFDKSGKVSYVELVPDPSNPKMFKMIVPKVVTLPKNAIAAVPATGVNGTGALTPTVPVATVIRQKNHKVFAMDSTKVPVQLQLQQTAQQPPQQQIQQQQQPQQMQQLRQILPTQPPKPQILYPLPKLQKPIAPKPAQPQQQSLLKPQISLLKLSQGAKRPVKVIRVNNIAGLKNRNINVFVPSNLKMESGDTRPSKPNEQSPEPRNVTDQLEADFFGQSFSNVTMAVGWLLKRLPLISTSATNADYKQAFPFVTRSSADFQSFHLAKQRSFEVN